MDIKLMEVQINILKEKIALYKAENRNFDEENTKMALILPFFVQLGYDVFNPFEFRAELLSDCRTNGNEKVDYSILVEDKPKMIVEAKRFGESLKQHIGQLKRYYNSNTDIRYGVLTNGVLYLFFTDTKHTNIMDDNPFYEIDIENIKEKDINFLQYISKPNFIIEDEGVNDFMVKERLEKFFTEQYKNPSDEFVEFVKNALGVKEIKKDTMIHFFSSLNEKTPLPKEEKIEVIQTIETKTIENTSLERKKSPSILPKKVILIDKELKIDKWKGILLQSLEELIIRNPDIMNKLNESKKNKFSYQEKDLASHSLPRKLSNGLFVYTNLNSESIVKFIREMLVLCGYSENDLIIEE